MVFFVISISSDSSKESVGTSTARVILFGTIPTTILPTTPTIDLPVIHDNTLLTPTISPTIPTIPPIAPTIQYTSLFINTDSSNSDNPNSPPLQDPYEIAVAQWRSRVVARSSPPSSPIHYILLAPPRLPCRLVVLVLPGHSIPIGRPYRTLPNGVLKMLTVRKDSDSLTDLEVSLEDGYVPYVPREVGLGVDVEDSYEPYTEPDIDTDIQADIDECIAYADAIRVIEDDVRESVREDVLDHVTTDGAVEVIESEQRLQGHRITGVDLEVTTMTERISALEWDNTRLKAISVPTATRSEMTQYAINELIAKRVDEALKPYDAARNPKIEAEIKNDQQDDHVEENVNHGNSYKNVNGNPNGTKGVVALTRWFEKMETVFHISNCPPRYQVKYATCTLLDGALTWWNSHKRTVGVDDAYAMTWKALMKLMTERFQELTLLCTKMVLEDEDKVEKYIGGLPDSIQGNVIAAEPVRL
ncbi:hypothetical protein Tco_0822010 [Tanacetum coccineum]|uniref:Reverse transcriptase domain-containing protein n=1 Tax=Tanacetum coccineum TaxID=301880 RepID=A0ABQ5AI34_9ASTR